MAKKLNLDKDGELKRLADEFQKMGSEEELREKTEAAEAKVAATSPGSSAPQAQPIWLIIGVFGLLVLGAGSLMVWKGLHKPARPVAVPSVIGLTQEQARATLINGNLRVQVTFNAGSQAPTNTVISQLPNPGEVAKEGDTVSIVVSGERPNTTTTNPNTPEPHTQALPGEQVAVPDCLFTEASAVEKKLEAAGFKVEIVEGSDAAHPAGVVIDCDPKPATQLPKGSTIHITVNNLTVQLLPDYSGKSAETVIEELKTKGYVTARTDVPSTAQPAGVVINTEPKANTAVKPGEKITLVVAQ